MTQHAIEKSLTLIAWEAMNHWKSDGGFGLHVFHKNNEIAGYCSVLHALQLCGSTGDYGRRLDAVVIGFGATARGAVTVLNAHGIHDVRVLTNRDTAAVGSPIPSIDIIQFEHDPDAPFASTVNTEDGPDRVVPSFLAAHDIVVNCTLQDPNAPLTYLRTEDLGGVHPGSLIVDVSIDAGMGFEWVRPTLFADPMFTVGDSTNYYAVDHSPSYLWNSATWEISEALMPFFRTVMEGPGAWVAFGHHQPRDRDRSRAHPQRGDPRVPAALGRIPASSPRLTTVSGQRRISSTGGSVLGPTVIDGFAEGCRRGELPERGIRCNRGQLIQIRLLRREQPGLEQLVQLLGRRCARRGR